jgi:U32 family peptidase
MKKKQILNKPEIMSPAGDWISLRAALDAGCDAVYFGVQGFNMRAGADNFTAASFGRIARMSHAAGARAYLALNTIVYEGELRKIRALLARALAAQIDAVICWDFAVIGEARRLGLPVFASTQVSVSNSAALLQMHRQFGIRRFVLARECSIDDMKKIRTSLAKALGQGAREIEIEVFAHGAMCVSVSGRCFLSQFEHGKSANRGECLQTCRREFIVRDRLRGHELALGNKYILSPKDLCVLPFIERLIEAGAASFKIEGRSRSPEYVATVTGAYRRAVDFYADYRHEPDFKLRFDLLKNELMEALARVYNRGFSSGFYLGRPIDQWHEVEGSIATTRKEYSGLVTNFYKQHGVAEIRIESNEFVPGDEIMFQGATTGVYSQKVEAIEINRTRVDRARKGTSVAVKTGRLVRRGDKVYVIKLQNTGGRSQKTGAGR